CQGNTQPWWAPCAFWGIGTVNLAYFGRRENTGKRPGRVVFGGFSGNAGAPFAGLGLAAALRGRLRRGGAAGPGPAFLNGCAASAASGARARGGGGTPRRTEEATARSRPRGRPANPISRS